MTDGSAWRQPDGVARQGAPGARSTSTTGTGQSPWWSDALGDPWRDPDAPSAVVIRPAAAPPPLEPDPTITAPGERRSLGMVFLVAVVTALLAGALGGTLGYVFATKGGAPGQTVLGAAGNGTPASLAVRPPDSLAGVASRVLPSVVTIKVGTDSGYSLGSGFIASSDGYVITNDHVVEGEKGQATVTFSDSTTVDAKVVGEDQESDVAVLKLSKSGLQPVQFGDSDQVAVGDPVLAIGSPLALANTVTSGIVSSLNRTIEADEPGGPTRYYSAIQTDAAINHGNSGGPLVDAGGRVIGMNSVIRSMASDADEAGNIGLAFAIPINQAKRIAQDIINNGKARRTVIGAELSNSYQNPNGGVEVTVVPSGGPAANAGIKPGDVLTRINNVPLEEPADLIALVRMYAPGQAVNVQYQRDGGPHTVQVTLAADSN
ncbi:S1C family serine protease [Rugosimonospora acidiphila]|uniref:S1C family serine protease n=1 Tax=Rugosimonospora acidiphila TaxID=556531 RepID=UPI0031EF5758